MSIPRFACNAVITFDLFALPDWVRAERAAGRLASHESPVEVSVVHPDREMDGSCRWCGCRENEIVSVDA
jgi:hypothetical protein